MSLNLKLKFFNFRIFYHNRWSKLLFAILIIQIIPMIYILLRSRNKFNSINNVVVFPKYNESERLKIETQKKCFESPPNLDKIVLLPDIFEHEIKPEPDKSIFFIVTTCPSNGSVILNSRQCCSIESAAKYNPNRNIFVLFASPVGFEPNKTVSPIIKSLQSYPNIRFRNLNIIKYSIGTPGEEWIRTDRIYLSKFIMAHMSDYLRFLTMYKFGGIYFDLDIIVLKNVDGMPPNFLGAENEFATGNCVLGFESGDVGHKIIEMISRENTENYRPNEWSSSGVGAATRVAHKVCKSNKTSTLPEFCWGLKIYPRSAFIPVPWGIHRHLFSSETKIMNEIFTAVKDSITIHSWNNLNSDTKIDKVKPKTAYGALAEMNCPKTYQSSGQYF